MRQSAVVSCGGKRLLIDCGPDFRTQMLKASSEHLDALMVTHEHYDHLAGIDDLRPYAMTGRPFPIYANSDVLRAIKRKMPYCFAPHRYPGAPHLELHEVKPGVPFLIDDIEVLPIEVFHHKPILGFRIGPMAYITDCKTIGEHQLEALSGVRLLVLNALRFTPHPTHLSVEESLQLISRVKPDKALLIHMSHEIGLHSAVEKVLPEGVELAHDGMIVSI